MSGPARDAFMPLALSCASDKSMFDQLFSMKMILLFIDTFFVLKESEKGEFYSVWERIQARLQKNQLIDH